MSMALAHGCAGDEFLDYGDLHLPLGKNDLIVTPVVAGSGGGGGGIGKILTWRWLCCH